jgi:hypothetical protein
LGPAGQLNRLFELRDAGLLPEEEYAMRVEIVNRA